MNDDEMRNFFENVTIVDPDGTHRPMTEEDMAGIVDGVKALEARGDDWSQVRDLQRGISDLTVDGFFGYCPVQGYGTYQGEDFYFRARGQHATLSVGSTDGKEVSSWNARRQASVQVSDDEYGAGYLTPQDVMTVMPFLLSHLEERTQEQNDAKMQAFVDTVNAMVEQMKKDES